MNGLCKGRLVCAVVEKMTKIVIEIVYKKGKNDILCISKNKE
jgi:hypothetical protein